MTHNEKVEKVLKAKNKPVFKAIDLFAGCGGLALGFEANGFATIGFEMNRDACKTYSANLNGVCHNVNLTTLTRYPKADIIIGGPPCQPFSILGKQHGSIDSRNGFPICLDAVKKVKPKLFVFENVRGLMYKNKWYLEELQKEFRALKYDVKIEILNAKDYDVPQNRERIFIIGTRKVDFIFPMKKHYKVTAGEALGGLAFQMPPDSKLVTSEMQKYIDSYETASKCTTERDLHLDRPARTLTCRNLSGSTGDMHRIKLPDGAKRRLTVQEAAKLQTFPDWYKFAGVESSIFKQIGNAVPPMMSYHIARRVRIALEH